jgi:prepilin-type N-terminal cleavage/methylation domain-containing protein
MKTRTATCSAFTMVEVLIAVTILSILLVAIATAFNASAMNYKENAGIAEAMNSARQALTRMTTLIRTGYPVPADTAANTCSLLTADGQDIVLSYDSAQKKLYYVTASTTDTDPVLCEHVTAMTFTKSLVAGDVQSVVINMTVTVNGVSETFSAAAVVRKNL